MLDIGAEDIAIHWPVDDHGRGKAGAAQTGGEGGGPWGIAARQRCPRGARPRRRAIWVVTPVSSIKTSFFGSRLGWPSDQVSRAAVTSSRCCALACAVFF